MCAAKRPSQGETTAPPEPSQAAGAASPGAHAEESAKADTGVPAISMEDPRIGRVLSGRYRLEELIGKGGMGRVYRATQLPLNRSVAVKILSPEFQRKDRQFVRRFFLEAATAARLTHPNTITVFDYGESESGELFIAMEYLRGRSLSRLIATEGPVSSERALHVAIQICRALREAHEKGIIHRDLKPGNILLLSEGDDADFVKVLDFGLVKLFTPPGSQAAREEPVASEIEGEVTRAGMFLGSPKYMSPEQIQGLELDPRTDVYALGVLMFQMVAGKTPFGGATSVEVIYKHVNEPVPRVREVNPAVFVPEELEEVIRRCLAKKREDRFDSMGALLARLKEVRQALTGASSTSEIGVAASLGLVLEPRAVEIVVPPPEAPFVEIADDTPSAVVRPSAPSARTHGRLARLAPVIAGLALAVVLGVLAYVLSSQPAVPVGPPVPLHPSRVVPTAGSGGGAAEGAQAAEIHLMFESTPSGARVYEGDRLVGVTPCEATAPSSLGRGGMRRFTFKLDGYLDEPIDAAPVGERTTITATLRRRPDVDRKEHTDSDYKENPY